MGLNLKVLVILSLAAGVSFNLSPLDANEARDDVPQLEGDPTAPPEVFKDVYRDDLFAVLKTSEGDIRIQLAGRDSPQNVENFINLARGSKEFTDLTGRRIFRPFYDGLTFHRVLEGFLIQGGCPMGNGTGGPGYQMDDELRQHVRFDEPGVVGFSNYGPNTNGSQIFITTGRHQSLNGKHTLLGRVVDGWETVQKINSTNVDGLARPLFPIVIESVEIYRSDERI